jgi:hypothetical protein
MKSTVLILLTIMFTSEGISQGVYPLDSANVWQHEETDPTYYWMIESRVVGQVVMPNGITYTSVSCFGIGSGAYYVRQVGAIVYAYNSLDSTEFAFYNYSASVGDTISVRYQPYRSIVLLAMDTVNFYGRQLTRWVFHEEGPAWFSTHTVIDSVGLSYIWMEPGIAFALQGAIINGIQYGTIVSVDLEESFLPQTLVLRQNYPNPFNSSTVIPFRLTKPSTANVTIFSVLGQKVATLLSNAPLDEGEHALVWNASGQPSGVYIYRLESGTQIVSRKMVLMK